MHIPRCRATLRCRCLPARARPGLQPLVAVHEERFSSLCAINGEDRYTNSMLADVFQCTMSRVISLKANLKLTRVGVHGPPPSVAGDLPLFKHLFGSRGKTSKLISRPTSRFSEKCRNLLVGLSGKPLRMRQDQQADLFTNKQISTLFRFLADFYTFRLLTAPCQTSQTDSWVHAAHEACTHSTNFTCCHCSTSPLFSSRSLSL